MRNDEGIHMMAREAIVDSAGCVSVSALGSGISTPRTRPASPTERVSPFSVSNSTVMQARGVTKYSFSCSR